MLKLKVMGSSSKGNEYVLQNNKSTIILDCGVKNTKDNVDLQKVDGILITHQHL